MELLDSKGRQIHRSNLTAGLFLNSISVTTGPWCVGPIRLVGDSHSTFSDGMFPPNRLKGVHAPCLDLIFGARPTSLNHRIITRPGLIFGFGQAGKGWDWD